MIEAPFSELDYSSDYLDEFHGFLEDEDENQMNEEDKEIYGAIGRDNQDDPYAFNRAGERINVHSEEEELKETTPISNIIEEEEEKTGGLPLKPLQTPSTVSKSK